MRSHHRRIVPEGAEELHGPLVPLCLPFSLSGDCIEPDPGMNPAEAAEEAPGDPDADAFYKTGRRKERK